MSLANILNPEVITRIRAPIHEAQTLPREAFTSEAFLCAERDLPLPPTTALPFREQCCKLLTQQKSLLFLAAELADKACRYLLSQPRNALAHRVFTDHRALSADSPEMVQ